MKIKYNSEKLKKVIDDFVKVTKLSIAVHAADMSKIASSMPDNAAYCMEIHKADGGEKCLCCDTELLMKCRETGQIVRHVCHAGLVDTVVPILKNKIPIGYIMIGRIKQNPNFDEIYKFVSDAGEYAHLKKLYKNVKYYNEEETSAVAELALMLTSFILLNDIINTEYDAFSAEADAYIEQNLKKEITVNMLCRKFNVSKNYLYEHFRSSFNCTVNEYIVSKRIEYAKKLLMDSDMPVNNIAEECGVFNHTYFCRLFKRKTGISPLQYRKINSAVQIL